MGGLPDRYVDGMRLQASERRYVVRMGQNYDVIEMRDRIDVLRWDGSLLAADLKTMKAAINAIRRDVKDVTP
jgi:hypothetical protein